jgi:hypothetical protein
MRVSTYPVLFVCQDTRQLIGVQIRRTHRSAAVKAVFSEQHRQEAGRFHETGEIAKVYKGCTARCQVTSQMSALSDMRIARSMFDEEFNNVTTELHPEILCSQTAPRGRILRRICRMF